MKSPRATEDLQSASPETPYQKPHWKRWGLCITSVNDCAIALGRHDVVAKYLEAHPEIADRWDKKESSYREVWCLASGKKWDGRT